ncbi:DNA replication checkpoint protein tel2 [Fulvia fulva]|uniref:DNA replication checkpoint protein tel2 n=1 Tax=Passalora fulva TaxID=5499 RepID=A0A9Q8P6D6_PASFU|nr:DNA replication checkpoint protein tel2 [Fulvia fulva]KAK4629350.1 DNA replication checkpoint protein tel2 [Fulvia fulva]KAK4630740.1 DNA replication checkpoint protein tel2 [Fulvia fulva]UJO14836.1 DNA replication checkpoint protein tel2 [Fulvia fulva]WPV12272.1 DNA replication checkpoint protein tel2 [Fulvia fulva]WPV27234.1 DNA replication checkpoint protein tel2 [Fulvia fulva]
MADFLTAVKSVSVKQRSDDAPAQLLQALSRPPVQRPTPIVLAYTEPQKPPQHPGSINSPRHCLQALRSQPAAHDLIGILGRILKHDGDFDIRAPGPLQAQIINTLVSSIVPTFCSPLQKSDTSLLVRCLRSVAGSNALVARLRFLLDSSEKSKPSDGSASELEALLLLARELFVGDDFALTIWTGLTEALTDDRKRHMACKDFIGLMASGKLTATIARAEDTLSTKDASRKIKPSPWLTRGAEYAAWLGRNVDALCAGGDEQRSTAASQLLSRAFGLGYSTHLIQSVIMSSIRKAVQRSEATTRTLAALSLNLPEYDQRRLLENASRWLSAISAQQDSSEELIAAIAAVIDSLAAPSASTQRALLELLSDPALPSAFSFAVRRACVAVLAKLGPDELQTLLERILTCFGDRLFIDHAPIVQQECAAQVLLLCAGSLHRTTPMAVLMTARSSGHMQGVSNRLDSSNSKSRWLGMVVGTALSKLVDKEGSRMNFGTEDMQTDEAKWYGSMISLTAHIGTIAESLQFLEGSSQGARKALRPVAKSVQLPIINGKRTYGPERPPLPAQTGVEGEKVTEILDDEDDEDDDLKPYAKPDSDPEDSDEDATLVNRNKARAPVYVRDLMRMLKDDKDHDRFQLAIKSAPGLIRRKTDFGGEVRDHAEELALMLCDLQDPFDTEDFDELRLQTLIALLLTDVPILAPYLSKQGFSGDYSIAQRCLILSALGLGGRELAGFKDQDDLNPTLPASTTSFPSKRLPGHLHAIYSPGDLSVKRLEAASKNLEHRLIKPLALSAADETTSHLNAVKVRTFSSRMEVERTKRKPAPNQLAKVFGESFFSPLVSRYQQEISAYGQSSVFASAPFVVVTYLKTLALLLHASGPATLNLSDITTVFWDLLLSLRVQAISNISILEAVLFSLLTLLEVNDANKQRLAQETPKQLMETQQWVEVVFERTGGGHLVTDGSGEEVRVRTLAAGVLVKTRESIEGYQKMFIGGGYA